MPWWVWVIIAIGLDLSLAIFIGKFIAYGMGSKNKQLKNIQKVEEWKFYNCYNDNLLLCQECCSGGSLMGALCEDKQEEINKIQL